MLSWVKQLWNKQTASVTAAALVIGSASAGSRVLGVIRDRVLAGVFGAGNELDAYYAAFRLPDTVYALVVLGALSAGFIPVFSEVLERKGKELARILASQVSVVFGAVLLLGGFIIHVTAPLLAHRLFPAFDAQTIQTYIQLTRIMAWSPLLLGLSSVAGGILQVTRHYVVFALAPIFYNIGIILSAVLFGETYGITAIAYGVLIGALLHALSQFSMAASLGFFTSRKLLTKGTGIKSLLYLMGPRLLGLGLSQVSLTVVLAFVALAGTGSVSAWQFATNLQSFPLGIVGLSLAVAAFPVLSESYAKKDLAQFKTVLASALRQLFFFLAPATAIFFLLRAQIVRLVLGSGQFDWTDTIATANILGALAIALIAQSALPLLTRAFYAMHNTVTPFLIALVGEGMTMFAAWELSHVYGAMGVAGALVIGSWAQCLLFIVLLRGKLGAYIKGDTMLSVYKTLLATIAFCFVALPVREWVGTVYDLRSVWQLALQTFGSIFAGGIAFLFVAHIVQSAEYLEIRETVVRKFWRSNASKSLDEESILL